MHTSVELNCILVDLFSMGLCKCKHLILENGLKNACVISCAAFSPTKSGRGQLKVPLCVGEAIALGEV